MGIGADIGVPRVRCVFSESLRVQTLGVGAGGPPGGAEQIRAESSWRAVVRVLRSPAGWGRGLLNDLVLLFFPANCRSCDGPLERAGVVPVCEACVGRVTRDTMAACERCGEAINLDLDMEDMRFAKLLAEGLQCRVCRLAAPEFSRAVSFGTYEGELRVLVHLLKFRHVKGVARLLGGRMAEAMLQLEGQAAKELMVVAVPLFAARERERGYNQSVLLTGAALRVLGKVRPEWRLTEAHGCLVRKKRTEAQWVLSLKGRRRNLKGAFEVQGEVHGREVLLIDDILTSGATARECARVLRRAGAAKVWVATLARAQKTFVRHQHEDASEYVAAWDMPAKSAV